MAAGGTVGEAAAAEAAWEGVAVAGARLRLTVLSAGTLWGERRAGAAWVDLGPALARPGVPRQHTVPLLPPGALPPDRAAPGGAGAAPCGSVTLTLVARPLPAAAAGAAAAGGERYRLSVPALTPAAQAQRFLPVTDPAGRTVAQVFFAYPPPRSPPPGLSPRPPPARPAHRP